MSGFNIDALDLQDDLDVSVDQNDYAEASVPLPVPKGNYGFTIKAETMKLRTEKDGKTPVLRKGFPVLTIGMVTIVDAGNSEAGEKLKGRAVPLYQDFSLAPFDRDGKKANILGDILRSANPSASFSGVKEGLMLLEQEATSGSVFYARMDWTASDMAAASEAADQLRELAEAQGQDTDSPEVKKAVGDVYNKFRKRGMSKFKNDKGEVVPFMLSTTGEQIPVRVEVPGQSGFIPQTQLDKVSLGPQGR